jgi:PPOX class probable F420-dependent enzyme
MTATTLAQRGDAASLGTVPIPATHVDLLTRPICGVLTTMSPAGQPRSSLVWVGFDGECATVNTSLERHKGRDLLANPRLSLLVVDPENTNRFVQIRGDAEFVTDGAIEDLDATTRAYTGKPCFYGHIYPIEQRARETRVICRIHARRVTLDAIYSQRRQGEGDGDRSGCS